jgi:SAM-dependent methyltransferase
MTTSTTNSSQVSEESSFNLFEVAVAANKIFRRPHLRSVRQYISHIIGNKPLDGQRVLDIGGGVGLLSLWAAHKGATVTCLEPEADGSTHGVENTFRRLHDIIQPGKKVEYLRLTMEQYFEQSAEKFDLILLINCINHLNENSVATLHQSDAAKAVYRGILQGIVSALNVNGRLLITDCSRRNVFADLRMHNPLMPTIEWHKHQSPRVWMSLLSEIGLRKLELCWSAPDGLGAIGQLMLGNGIASYLTTSMFRLTASRTSK